MVLSSDLTTRLLGAIETDSLVLLCGAGLSMPSPSDLPSALRVSQDCYDAWVKIESIEPALRDNVDDLAWHFHKRGDFTKVFINKLVPWNDFAGTPNGGHAAVSDLLISRGAHAALSANFDMMVERWAEMHKIAMRGALTGQEATDFESETKPLIKFHGCMCRDRENTLWTQGQLAEPAVQARISSCSQWMNLHLPGKHLLVVGFWTDWGYLNDVLANAFAIDNASSVTVIDSSPTADLQVKAPSLWTKLTSMSNVFEHVPASGEDVLNELRTAYSRTWARKFYALGQRSVQEVTGSLAVANPFDTLEGEDLYNLRRDAQGVPYNRAATAKDPPLHAAHAAYAHGILLSAGAKRKGAWLLYGSQSIRIVNGGGRALRVVQGEYKEPTIVPQADIVLCAGAFDYGVPAKLIAPGRGASTIRPTPGGSARWLTLEQVQKEFGL